MAEALITCMRCNKKSPMSQMSYSSDGEDILCQICANPGMAQKQNISQSSTRSPGSMSSSWGSSYSSGAINSGSSSAKSAKSNAASAAKTIRYLCTSCNYKFSRASKTELTCPYCNKKTLRKEFQLISDVDALVGDNLY